MFSAIYPEAAPVMKSYCGVDFNIMSWVIFEVFFNSGRTHEFEESRAMLTGTEMNDHLS